MTSAMKQSFGAELSRIAGKMKESAAWPSPCTGLAFHILQLLDDDQRHWPDSIKITFPEGQLDTAPLIASAGYSMCIAAPNPEQSARWQSALARIVKQDPFPRDRQTFAFRPSELVGIALGVSKSNLVGSASGSWVRWVIETLPTKNPTPDIWALLLYHYAAALVGIIWPTHLSSRLADYELPDWSLLLGLLTSGGIKSPPDIGNRKLEFAIVQRAVALSEDFREPEKLAALLAGISCALRNEIENSVALESKKTSQSAQNMSEQPNPLQYQRQSPAKEAKRPLVVVVHGIRTSGKWFQRIKPILEREADCVAEPAGFGFLNLFRFLLPGPTRRAVIEIVKRKLIHAIELHKGRPLIIIAHSFGTYCITNILKDSPQIRPRRLLFCGSIVDQEFRWDSLSQMAPELKMAVINECGERDIWPPLAHSMTWGYGGSGSGGFQFPGVVDRHHDLGHSGFFSNEFVQEFWVPFVRDGTVAASKYEEGIPETPWWIHMLGLRPLLPWIAWIGLALLGLAASFFISRVMDARPPLGSMSFEALTQLLPSSLVDHKFSQQVEYKARMFDGLGSIQAERIVTFFLEAPKAAGPGFVKVQAIVFPQSAKGPIYFRPYSSESTGGSAKQVVFQIVAGKPSAPLPEITRGIDRVVPVTLEGGDTLGVIAIYNGCLVDGYLESDGNGREWRDWHQVEVSDFARTGGVEYFFATGSPNYEVSILAQYDAGATRSGSLWFLPTVGGRAMRAANIESIVARDILQLAGLGVTQFNSSPCREAFGLLSSEAALRAAAVHWATDEQRSQAEDVFYVTRCFLPPGASKPCEH